MKGKKILALLMAMLLVVTAVVTLVACTDGNVNGTYYLFKNEKIQKDSFITLDGSTWKDENGDSGSYTVSGKAITLYVELLGEKVEYATGSIDNGVLTITIMGEEIVYCKEGKEPSGGNDKPPVTIKYSVTYDANKGIFKNNVSTLVTSDLASQSLLTAPESPTRDGYNFSGWSKSKNKSDMWNFATDKITSNITLYAVWQQESATIFSMEGASINGKKIFMLVDSATDSVSLSNKIVCSEDSTWRLYYDKLGQMEIPTKIAASRNGELVDGNNVFYIVVTSSNGTQVNVYELTVYRSFRISINYYDGDILLHSTPLYSGDKITSDDVYSYVKEGYTFNAWRTSDGQEFKPGEIWGSVTLFADTTANEYTVTLNTNGGDELKNNTKTVTYDSKYNLPVLSRDGYTFAGWYLDNTMLTDEYGESLTAWNYTSDKELTAKWIINEHTVAIESNYPTAGVIKGAGKYDFGSTINISVVENMGYKYLGLYNGDEKLTDETEYTFTLADEEVSLTAKFEPVAEMANFNFTATSTNCQIISVLNNTADSIIVPSYVSEIKPGAFYGCNSVKSLTLPSLAENSLGYMFADSRGYIYVPRSLKNVIITGGKSISNEAFKNCENITTITIPESVTSIGNYAFYGCSSLTSITLPFVGKELGGVNNTHFGYIFGASNYNDNSKYVPESLKEVVITGGVSIGNSAFRDCSSLTNVTIPNSLTSIGSYAFYGCSGLTSVTIGNSVTSIGEYAFFGCSNISEVKYNGTIEQWLTISGLGSIMGHGSIYIGGSEITGDLVIPDSVTSISDYAFAYCSSLTSVTMGNSVTSIGYRAFYDCSGLTSVTIGSGVTSIGNSSFSGCSSLTSVTIPDSVTSIGSSAFYNCSSLTSVTIGSGVTSIGTEAFYYCRGLTSVTIGSAVTSIGNSAFRGCSSLTSVIIPDSVTSIGSSAFYDCSSLTSVIIPDSVTSISDYAFRYCSGLTSVTIPDSVTSIGSYAFSGCSSLTSVIIPDSVTSIGAEAFSGCSSLTSVTIPDSVTSIGDYAFKYCSSISEVKYNGTIEQWLNISGLSNLMGYGTNKKLYISGNEITELVIPNGKTSIRNYAFYGCSSLTSITIPESVTSIGDYAFKDCSSISEVKYNGTIEQWLAISGLSNLMGYGSNKKLYIGGNEVAGDLVIPNGVTSIRNYAFYDCSSLTSVTIPDSVTSIGRYAFSGCSSLISITLPFVGLKLGGTSNTHFGYIFGASKYEENSEYVPESLKEVIITGGENIGSFAFYGCSGLTSVTIANSVTSIGSSAFYNCSGLTSITIPDGVLSIGLSAFSGCSNLISITLPFVGAKLDGTGKTHFGYIFGASKYEENSEYLHESLKEVIITGEENIGSYAFYGCSNLTSVTIPDSVTSIGSSAFSGCTGLTSMTIPDSVTSIGSSAFAYCTGLTSMTIPNSVTSIGSSAFSGCSALTSMTIPDSVTSIGSSAFSGCSVLTSMTIPDSVTSIGSSAFSGCSALTSITLPFVGAKLGGTENTYFGYIFGASEYRKNADYVPKSLKEVIIKGGENIDSYAFYNCSSLTSVTMGNSVTNIGSSAFYGCSALTSITLPFVGAKLGGTSNTHFGYIFGAGSYSYNSNYVPKSLNEVIITGGKSIGNYAFYGCSNLNNVTIPDSVTKIGASAFEGCSNMSDMRYNGTIAQWCSISGLDNLMRYSSNKTLYFGGSEITSIVIPEGVTSINSYAFYGCNNFTSVIIPDSVTSIGQYAFYGCNSLTSITLPFVGATLGGTSNTHFGYIFGADSYSYNDDYVPNSLKEVIIKGSESIGYDAFSGCSGLTSVTIPDSVTSIGSSAFYGCNNISEVKYNGTIEQWLNISGLDNLMAYSPNKKLYIGGNELTELVISDSVTSIGESAFFGYSSLTSVTIGNSVTSIGKYAFKGCSSLTSVTIGSSVTSIGKEAFYGCSGLTSMIIPNSVTIGSSAFYNCSSLTSITLPFVGKELSGKNSTHFGYIFGASNYNDNSKYVPKSLKEVVITGGESIGSYAFYECSGLTNVTMLSSVTSIGDYAFYNCSALTSVTIGSGVTSIGASAFSGCSSLTSVNFENTIGWFVSRSFNGINSTDISVTAPALNAKYLTSTYYNYYWWKRK